MELVASGVSRRFLRARGDSNIFMAVQPTDLRLAGGSLTVLTGRSGSGKSTLLNLLAGLLVPTAGTVTLDGTDLYALDDAARSRLRGAAIGVIPQGHTALGSLTVLENVLLPALLRGEQPDRRRGEALLERLGIAALAEALPGALSGGELRRAAIARSLLLRPRVLLADEPTADLDDGNTRAVLALLRETADAGAAVLLVTHEREAAAYADAAARMDGGVLSPAP